MMVGGPARSGPFQLRLRLCFHLSRPTQGRAFGPFLGRRCWATIRRHETSEAIPRPAYDRHEAPDADRDGEAVRRQRRAWEPNSGNDFPTVTESPLPPPPHALPDLNGASAPGKGPRLAALRPHHPLARHGHHVLDGRGRATATEEGPTGRRVFPALTGQETGEGKGARSGSGRGRCARAQGSLGDPVQLAPVNCHTVSSQPASSPIRPRDSLSDSQPSDEFARQSIVESGRAAS